MALALHICLGYSKLSKDSRRCVSGCSGPSTSSRTSAAPKRGVRHFILALFLETQAGLLRPLSAFRCSGPSNLSNSSQARQCIASASSYLPVFGNTGKIVEPQSVFGCSGPSTLIFQRSPKHRFRLFIPAQTIQKKPKLLTLGSVSRCTGHSTFSHTFNTRQNIAFASHTCQFSKVKPRWRRL